MAENFDLQQYLNKGVENIIKGIMKATLANPRASLYLAKYGKASKTATKRRQAAERNGDHVPPFLIASITSQCNLHCAGCYALANQGCEGKDTGVLTKTQWRKLFGEAEELGIGFILLAGGEPLLRKDVIETAGTVPNILFPIFTNGTLLTEAYLDLFDQCRNLVPVISLEGQERFTDQRRGNGVYRKIEAVMGGLQEKGIVYGVSVTVTTENLEEVTSVAFLDRLKGKGCKGVIYVEFVPVGDNLVTLAPGDAERKRFDSRLQLLRDQCKDMVLVSFPGDEKSSGGCLAAGRGFFHINATGGAEPCPFSPYSDYNVTDGSLKEALRSELFTKLRDKGMLLAEHDGGCTLFDQKERVAALLK